MGSVGLPEALRVYVDGEICGRLCGETCQKIICGQKSKCRHAEITERLFSHETWRKDAQKLEHEQAQARGVSEGGHFIYLVRKCRELPDTNPRLSDCSLLRNLPPYNSLEFDLFKVQKMRPLRKTLQELAKANAAMNPSSIKKRKRAVAGPPGPGAAAPPVISVGVQQGIQEVDTGWASTLESDDDQQSWSLEEIINVLSSDDDEATDAMAGQAQYRSLAAPEVENPSVGATDVRRARWRELIQAFAAELAQVQGSDEYEGGEEDEEGEED